MIDLQDAVEAVERDVTEALAAPLDPRDRGGFSLSDEIDVTDNPIADSDSTVMVVPWVWRGVNTGGIFGLDPTFRPVTVRGVTLVTEDGDRLLLHRYVDWLEVMGQAGIAVNTRPLVDIRAAYDEEALREVPELAEALDLADQLGRPPSVD